MNEIVSRLDAGSSVLARMSIEELRADLASTLTMTAKHLVHLADVWQELQRRGEDLSELKSGLWVYMPLIAKGELRAELIVRYAGNSLLLRRLAGLSLHDQDQLLRAGAVDLATWNGDEIVVRKVELIQLRAPEMARVIRDRIVPVAEQQRYLIASLPGSPKRKTNSPTERALAAAELRSRSPRPRKVHALVVKLSDSEVAALKQWAQINKVSLGSLTGGALSAAGLLQPPTDAVALADDLKGEEGGS